MFKSLLLKGRTLCLLLCCMVSSLVVTAQTKHTGKVIGSDDKLPIVGASVRIQGTNTGAVTDVNGDFSLTVSPGQVLEVSYIGYVTQRVTVAGSGPISISLVSTNNSLNEVVVTGYTSQKKKDITGAVAIVDVASLKTVPAGNTATLLQGQASGVAVTNSGSPGGGTSINIRGIGSIFSTAPLVMIDGTSGSLNDINPNDIESIQVLKDAGAASIYGVRGANGVVVVTTKKGKQGKSTITYDAFYGTTQALKDGFKLANTQTYMQAEYESYKNDGLTGAGHPNTQFDPKATGTYSIPDFITPAAAHVGDPKTTIADYNLNPLTGVGSNPITLANKQGTDWFHSVFSDAPIQSHNITASGGSDKSNYLMSLGYYNETGTLLSTYEKRYSLRVNTNFNVKDHVRVGETIYFYYKKNPQIGNQNEGNLVSFIYREPPIIPIYDLAGNFAGSRSPGLSNSQNPFANASRAATNADNDWNMSGNVFAEFDFLKHFTARTQFGGSIDNYEYHRFSPDFYENAEGNTGGNGYVEGAQYQSNYTWQNTLKYNQTFGKHSVNVLVGQEYITSTGRNVQGNKGGYTVSTSLDYVTLNTGSPTGQAPSNQFLYANTLESIFARVEYAFNDKYLLNGNIRRDGSSFFAPGHQWGTFPSGSVAWRLSKEDFLKGVSWLNDAKLRVGYGALGSLSGVQTQANNAYDLYAANPGGSYYDINGTSNSTILGTQKSQIGNLSTTWETDKVSDVGLDFSIFNKIDVSVDYFKKTVSNLLFKKTLSPQDGGASAPYVNAGDLQNTGFDFNINFHDNIGDFKYSIGLNATHYANLVKALPKGTAYLDINSSGSTRLQNFVRLQPGQPVGEFFGYKEVGLYKDAADVSGSPGYQGAKPGLLKFADVNGDGKIDANDRTFIGNPNPSIYGGLNLTGSYKGFDFAAFFYGVAGNDVVNYTKYWTDFPQVFDGNVSANIITDSWHPGADNSKATIPVLTRQASLGNTANFSSYYIESGSYLRLKSLQIGYTVPSATLKTIGIDKLRIYILGNNLFTATGYSGMDPELQNSNLGANTSFGIDFGNYPSNQKRYSVGVQATF